MIESLLCGYRSRLIVYPLALLASISITHATGFYGPQEYLGNGGTRLRATPEFYWDLETRRLAKDFHPTEKLAVAPQPASSDGTTSDDSNSLFKSTGTADLDDFADALKNGRIKPPDPAKATEQHGAARDAITVEAQRQLTSSVSQNTENDKGPEPLPEEFDSEFADYHRGAYAYRLGKEHWEEARKAWESLLARPADQRHYRSVWAAFMLGKMTMKQGDPSAVKWFEMTRQLAKDGFADSLGMAADSYGWQGRSEWKQGHPDKAAPLFLTQLALGDESAIVSLKALIPDRSPIEGMLNYGSEPEDVANWPAEQQRAAEEKALGALKAAAADPLLRRLVTAHILATETYGSDYSDSPRDQRSSRWLGMINAAGLSHVEDAEYLGWMAYNDGDYKAASHWLELADANSPASCWLRAKLQLRAGKLDDAIKSLSKGWEILRSIDKYTGTPPGEGGSEDQYNTYSENWSFPESASGDLAQLHLTHGDFVQSLDAFFKGGLKEDAAYVAERVLTADELKAYVDALPADSPKDATQWLQYLLGRRLVREDRYSEAGKYLPAPYAKILEKYAAALKEGADKKLTKAQRAQALSTAAWLARHDGMELMGTEVAPDSFLFEGSFENTDIAKERLRGKFEKVTYSNPDEKDVLLPILPPPSKKEQRRLEANAIHPDVRFHYRDIASGLALKAAALMDSDTPELADLLNTAGNWVKNSDEKMGNRVYQVLEQRCPGTEVGRAAMAKHWFVDTTGPWSEAQQATYDNLHKEVGLNTQ